MVHNNITFICPISQYYCNITCITRGLPLPNVTWTGGEEREDLSIANEINDNGLVMSTLILERRSNESIINGHYTCHSTNVYGSSQYTVQLTDTSDTPIMVTTPRLPNNNKRYILFRIILLTNKCDSDISIQGSLQTILSPSSPLTAVHSSCNGTKTIQVYNMTSLQSFDTLVKWWACGPTLLINGTLYAIDNTCDLLVNDSTSGGICVNNSTSPITTPSPTFSIATVPLSSLPTATTVPTVSVTPFPIIIIASLSVGLGILLLVIGITIIGIIVCGLIIYKSNSKSTKVDW